MKEKYTAFKAAIDEAEKDKNGITMPTNLDFGIVDDSAAQRGVDAEHSIKTLVPTSTVLLVSAELASAKGKSHASS
jgi:helicase MOV-10